MQRTEDFIAITTQMQRSVEQALSARLLKHHQDLARGMTSHIFLDAYLDSLQDLTPVIQRELKAYGMEQGLFNIELMGQFMAMKSAQEQAKEALEQHLSEHSRVEASAITLRLTERMSKAIYDGTSATQALTDLKGILNNPARLLRIARTEIHGAAERGSWEAANSLGVRVGKYWWSRHDTSTRPDHVAADGQLQEVDGLFTVGDQLLLYPGDTRASAQQVVNCRCTATYHPYVNGELSL